MHNGPLNVATGLDGAVDEANAVGFKQQASQQAHSGLECIRADEWVQAVPICECQAQGKIYNRCD